CYRACKGAGAAGLGVRTRLTMKLAQAVPLLWWAAISDPEMTAAEGPEILETWQNLVNAPAAFSSALSATASNDGASTIIAFGEYRVEKGDAREAADALRDLLDEQWLDMLSSTPLVLIQPFPI